MFSKTIFVVAFVAVAQFASAASPPGCMLGAINTYKTPSDIESVCKEKGAGSKIQEYCGDSTQQAMNAFADVCKAKGVEVSTDIPTSTASSSKASGTATSKPSGTGAATTLTTATGTAGAGSPQNTGAAASGNGESPSGTPTGTGGPAQSTGAAGRLEVAGLAVVAGILMAAL